MISECIRNLGPSPRSFSWWDRWNYLRISRPTWLWFDASDELQTFFRHALDVLEGGVVVWGHVIQANQLMFEPGSDNCPGEVVYSFHNPEQVDPEYLLHVARGLFELKGTRPTDPQLAPIADYLTDEMIRVFGLAVPHSISPALPCQISTTFFLRKHLPKGRLCAPILPLVVNRQPPFVALPLPARYWPAELVRWWTTPR